MPGTPPTLDEIRQRTAALKAVVQHAMMIPPAEALEQLSLKHGAAEIADLKKEMQEATDRLWEQVREAGGFDALTPHERRFVETPTDAVDPLDHVASCWRLESFQVLAWSLHLVSALPPIYQIADPEILHTRSSDIMDVTGARNHEEIDHRREIIELWNWRSRTRQLAEMDNPPLGENMKITDLDDIVRDTAGRAHKGGILYEVVDGDFGVDGTAYRDLDDDRWHMVGAITEERHFALNWLCGYSEGNQWELTPTDT